MTRWPPALALLLSCGARTEPDAPCAAATPAVVLVVDHSASMGALTARGTTWWHDLVAALEVTLPEREGEVDVGAVVFPVRNPRGQPEICRVPVERTVAVRRAGSAAVVAAVRSAQEPWGATPTYAALEEARAALRAVPAARPRFVVLITDGGPNCNEAIARADCDCFGAPARECLNQSGTTAFCSDTGRVLEGLAALRAEGVRTVVLGLDVEGPANAGYADALDRMADAGGFALGGGGRRFIAVGDAGRTADALRRALATVAQPARCGG